MPLVYCSLALAAVTAIYLTWKIHFASHLQRRRVLSERVAFMLWVMAEADDFPADLA